MTDKNLLLVWWLAESDYDNLNADGLPPYIQDEVFSREGRNGRGRTWVPDVIDCHQVEVPSCIRCDGKDTHGGIVFFKSDYEAVKKVGVGVISDAFGNMVI